MHTNKKKSQECSFYIWFTSIQLKEHHHQHHHPLNIIVAILARMQMPTGM
jgi:hypothetical protein